MSRRPVRSPSGPFLALLLGLVGSSSIQVAVGGERDALPVAADPSAVVHALNRLGYGPRPGDVEGVGQIGLEAYIERQLRPQAIEDAEVVSRLASLTTPGMTPVELLVAYPPPPFVKALGRRLERGMGMDPEAVADLFPEMDRKGKARPVVELGQAKLIRAVYSERQLEQVLVDFWFNHFNVFIGKGADRWLTASYENEAIRPHSLGNFRGLLGAVARHPAMLFYLDNWTSTAPGVEFSRRDMEPYADRAIREQGLPSGGVATLMLRERGVDTGAIEQAIERRQRYAGRAPRRPSRFSDPDEAQRRGLNENYARELLELHTLGVDGGYTQQDVVEVARCFTGWTLLPIHAGQGFVYVNELHDRGKKVVLGTTIKGKGQAEGEAVLDLLAAHPATARFVSLKLARRFVGDDPPASLVDRMAESFLESHGDIPAVLRTLFYSDEFWAPECRSAKIKTPFEFVVSALRATESDLDGRAGPLHALRQLGQAPYGAQPPTGYEDTAEAWVSTGALLDRMKFALGLAAGRIPGVSEISYPVTSPKESPADQVVNAGRRLMGHEPSSPTVDAIVEQFEDPDGSGGASFVLRSAEGRARLITGWLLASAEFQRR